MFSIFDAKNSSFSTKGASVMCIQQRTRTAIYQAALKGGGGKMAELDRVYKQLESILPLLGEVSKSRQMANRIGLLLLENDVRIVAPSCPDYSHKDGKYTFTHLGNGVPLLTQLHLNLFDALAEFLPEVQFQIVIADQEAHDQKLRTTVGGISEEGFRDRVFGSVQATRHAIGDRPYKVSMMTEQFPSLMELENTFAYEIERDPALQSRIIADTVSRQDMYRKIGVFDRDEMRARTIRTAAQYCALAHLSTTEGFLVCNHDTVNLGWYVRHGAAVLHNAVSIY